jgi:hypothetical protein
LPADRTPVGGYSLTIARRMLSLAARWLGQDRRRDAGEGGQHRHDRQAQHRGAEDGIPWFFMASTSAQPKNTPISRPSPARR